MKKTLIALISASVFGVASAGVSITGTVDASYQNQQITYGDGAKASQNAVANNNQGTSQVTFTGSEDLGGGLTASFKIENDFDASKDGTNNFGSKGGEQFVGLGGGFGTVKLGAPNYFSLGVQAGGNPFGTKIGSGFGTTGGTGHVRPAGNAVGYTSPSIGGLTVGVVRVNRTNADTNGTVTAVDPVTDIGASFTSGPVTAGVSRFTTDGTGAVQVNYSGSVAMGAVKVMGGGFTETSSAGATSKGNNVGVAFTMGQTTLMANYGKKNDESATNNDGKITAVGANYALSKNTSMYARYVTEKNDAPATTAGTTAYSDRKTMLAGLQVNF